MEFGTRTYEYFDSVFDQLERITCALVVFIENAGSKAESYHYEVFNRVLNEIRSQEIQAVSEICREYLGIKESVEDAAGIIRASEDSRTLLTEKLNEGEACLKRLLIQSRNIKEFHSATDNPNIPDKDDEVYRIFQGYRKIMEGYSVAKPREDDVLSATIYSFFHSSVNIYTALFEEYDKILNDLAEDIDNKRKQALYQKTQKSAARKAIAKAAGELAMTIGLAAVPDAAFEAMDAILPSAKIASVLGSSQENPSLLSALGITRKNAADIAVAGIDLVATASEQYGELLPKTSLARTALKKVKQFNDTMELGEGILSALNPSEDVTSEAKLAFAAMTMAAASGKIDSASESGEMDRVVQGAGYIGAVARVATGESVINSILRTPKMLSEGLGLVEEAAKYYEENDLHTSKAQKMFYNLGVQLKKYDDEVQKYKYNISRGMPAKKPRRPGFVTVRTVVNFVAALAEKGEGLYEAFK